MLTAEMGDDGKMGEMGGQFLMKRYSRQQITCQSPPSPSLSNSISRLPFFNT